MTKIEHLERRIPKENSRTTIPQMPTTCTLSQELQKERRAQIIQRTSQELSNH